MSKAAEKRSTPPPRFVSAWSGGRSCVVDETLLLRATEGRRALPEQAPPSSPSLSEIRALGVRAFEGHTTNPSRAYAIHLRGRRAAALARTRTPRLAGTAKSVATAASPASKPAPTSARAESGAANESDGPPGPPPPRTDDERALVHELLAMLGVGGGPLARFTTPQKPVGVVVMAPVETRATTIRRLRAALAARAPRLLALSDDRLLEEAILESQRAVDQDLASPIFRSSAGLIGLHALRAADRLRHLHARGDAAAAAAALVAPSPARPGRPRSEGTLEVLERAEALEQLVARLDGIDALILRRLDESDAALGRVLGMSDRAVAKRRRRVLELARRGAVA